MELAEIKDRHESCKSVCSLGPMMMVCEVDGCQKSRMIEDLFTPTVLERALRERRRRGTDRNR